MNISSRFSEFGMTGAFFWIAQLLYFALAHNTEVLESAPGWLASLDKYQPLTTALPQTLVAVSSSLLTAFGIIGIFVTGLILNLFGSYFFLFEDIYFNRHLDKNHSWLDKMISHCAGVVNEDYTTLRQEFGTRIFSSLPLSIRRAQLTSRCIRVQSFLFSYVHVFGTNGTPDMLNDHVHLWRTARAIGITFWVLSIEVLVFFLRDDHGSANTAIIAAGVLFLLGIYTTLRAYNRMCHTLFTLACATFGSQQGK